MLCNHLAHSIVYGLQNRLRWGQILPGGSDILGPERRRSLKYDALWRP